MINKDELLFVVDENNNPVAPKPRQEVHANGYWHRVAHIWIINNKKEFLCEKRSLLKDMFPGYWEPSFGGHMAPNVEYLDCAKSELKEEIGIDMVDAKLKFWKVYKSDIYKEFMAIYIYKWDGDINDIIMEKEEVTEISWIPFNDVYNFVLDGKDNGWVKKGYEKELFEFIQNNNL